MYAQNRELQVNRISKTSTKTQAEDKKLMARSDTEKENIPGS